jgi:ABC-type multidrug transport system ATPase subunit
MDEPTAGLDPNQVREFREHIRKLGEKKTVLISTHILQEVDATADRVLLIDEGRLIFDGTPAELKQGGSLEEPFYRLTNYGKPRQNAVLGDQPDTEEGKSALNSVGTNESEPRESTFTTGGDNEIQ